MTLNHDRAPTIGSLFTGYGGLEMGVQAAIGGTVAWHSEIEPAACKLLDIRFPGTPNIGDITAVDWGSVPRVDVLVGGFPCQDLSSAGNGAGLQHGTRSGLWANFAHAISELRPQLVIIENVRGLLSGKTEESRDHLSDRGRVVGRTGRAMGRVLRDLAHCGYDARWGVYRASDVGAPHRRERVFILATPADDSGTGSQGFSVSAARHQGDGRPTATGDRRDAGYPPLALLPTSLASEGEKQSANPETSLRRLTKGQQLGLIGTVQVMALMPTPKASDGPNGGPGMRNGRGVADALPGVAALLPTPVVNDMGVVKSLEWWDEWTERQRAQARNGNGHGASLSIEAQRFAKYAPAIARWEAVIGRPAPDPTEPNPRTGRPLLSPPFVEWMMGLPAGHVTGIPGLSYAAQLKLIGNGVVPQQAELAVRDLT